LQENNINFPPISTSEQLNDIIQSNIPQISQIAQDLLRRSAQLVACQMAGITTFKKQDMVFVMEGGLFWHGDNYKEIVTGTLKDLEPKYKTDIAEIKNSEILGAAKLIS